MADLLRVEDLRVAFQLHTACVEALRGISFRIQPGHVVALVGESGSGKSVTSQAAMGLLPKNGDIVSGSITFRDPASGETTVLTDLPRDGAEIRSIRGSRMSMIFQEPMNSLSPLHTIGDQVSEALTTHTRIDEKAARDATIDMLDKVGFPDPAAAYDMYAFELSGGLRQRAMIAMALICDPALLIADEPTTALDVTIQAQVLGLLKSLQRERNMGLLLITHDLGVVANMADEVIVIYHGEVMEAGPVDAIFRSPRHAYLNALLKAVPHFDMKPGERLVSLRDVETSAQDIGALRMSQPAEPAATVPSETNAPRSILSVRDVSKTFRSSKGSWLGLGGGARQVRAVDNVSLEIPRGACVGLVGESGCGKTTLSKLIMRAVTPDAGQILLGDGDDTIDLARARERELVKARKRVQMVFQDPVNSLSPRMTVLNIIREPMEIMGQGDREAQVARCVALMKAVGLDPRFLGRYPHSFSGGQRQRIGIARALALAPELLICDEPVSALDVSVQAQILNLLNDLRQELRLTYLFISHNLAVIDYVADTIAVMARGRIVELAPREALFNRPAHPYTRRLLNAVPFPDLDRKLDFKALSEDDASDPMSWPAAFRPDMGRDGATGLTPIEIGAGHQILARSNADVSELVA